MATSVTSTTFSDVYNDDYTDSADYHRILFNSGRALQARELTQMQTIIQKEVARLGNYMFKQGAIINASGGSLAARDNAIDFIVLSGWSGTAAEFADLVGKTIAHSDGLTARIKAVLTQAEATALTTIGSGVVTPGYTLLVEYVSDNQSGRSVFSAGDTVTPEAAWSGSGSVTIGSANTPIGRGSLVELPDLNMFANGFFLRADKQLIVLDPYDSQPTATIGYKAIEQVHTVSDDTALYDNSGATLNTTSPGADRYKITLTLVTESVITSADTFIPVMAINNGIAEAIITQDSQTNELGKLLADRTSAISGDFISKDPSGTFACEVSADSADSDFYNIIVSPGIGFVDGYRVQKLEQTIIRVEKPRSTTDDVTTQTNQSTNFNLGNYYLLDSVEGNLISLATGGTANLLDSANAIMGTVKIINLDKSFNGTDFDYKVHMADLSFNHNNGAGQNRKLADVRKLSDGSNNLVGTIKAIQGAYSVQDRRSSSLLYPLPKHRPHQAPSSGGTITADVQHTNTALTASSSKITITGTGSVTNPEDWIVIDTTSNLPVEGFVVSNLSGTTADISGGVPVITNGNVYEVLFYEQRTYNVGGRTYNSNVTATGVSLTNNEITIQDEIMVVNSIIDTTTSEEIKYKFDIQKDITDTHIGTSKLVLKTGETAPAGTVSYSIDTFTSITTNNNVYTRNSYNVPYKAMPTFRSKLGQTYHLERVVDLRYTKEISTDNYIKKAGLPKNNSLINLSEVKYWEPRIDRVYLSKSGNFDVMKGISGYDLRVPELPPGSMPLTDIALFPYVKNKKDHRANRVNNTGYKMSQIRHLEKRIQGLEEITTLTMSELSTKDLTVIDEDGLDRYKLGLTVDKFSHNTQSSLNSIEQRALIGKSTNMITPKVFWNDLNLEYDSNNSAHTLAIGDTVWPVHTEEEYLSQLTVSGPIDANSFTTRRFTGSGSISPSADAWGVSAVVTDIQGDTEVNRIEHQGNQLEDIDPYWKRLGYSSYIAFLRDNAL